MYYIDSQRTLTRRDSSLITSNRNKDEVDAWSLNHGQLSIAVASDWSASELIPKGMVQNELVTMLFESMLNCIVESWDPILPPYKSEVTYDNASFGKTPSDTLSITPGKKKKPPPKSSRTKRSRSRLAMESRQASEGPGLWWSAPDEKVVIRFKNGNLYEGNISMKCMHGEGRFQWADGTVYLGQFKDNEITGNGLIQWKDDTWYQGEFVSNLRHGQGLYVDSRLQRSYAGGWHCGTKHGKGAIYYNKTLSNSYDGEWTHNERFGYGSREYGTTSGYRGTWERNARDGKGLMIWPNNDCYRGEWNNGVMSGYGIYTWDSYYNNSMSMPSLKAYRGHWLEGKRNGYGLLNLGSGLGSFYKGEFKNDKKHGMGMFVTNNGFILQDKNLFMDDSMGPFNEQMVSNFASKRFVVEPHKYNICDSTVGLSYHVEQALKNVDMEDEKVATFVNEYIQNNNLNIPLEEVNKTQTISTFKDIRWKDEHKQERTEQDILKDLITFEELSLRNSIKCYETELRNIYYKYATICNKNEIYFTPVMMRLYLWQLYYDCNIHQKGLTLVEIDNTFFKNREWLAKKPHDPFEKIYFWQFLHSLITVASKLYAKRCLPGIRPDTILASGFRTFMEQDVLPGSKRQQGKLVAGYGQYIPLKAAYGLYQKLGEPHTIRNYVRAVRRSPHVFNRPQPYIIDAPDECLPLGRNSFIFWDELSFVIDNSLPKKIDVKNDDLDLFNFANLSTKSIIKIFAKIFPQIVSLNKVMDLNVELTFYEFFEALVGCIEESIKIKDEENKWRKKISALDPIIAPHSTPTGYR